MKRIAVVFTLALPGLVQADVPPQAIPVSVLPSAPMVDGNPAEWGGSGWQKIALKPALPRDERSKYGLDEGDERNMTGAITAQLKAGVHQGRFYLAVKYPDPAEDKEYKGWEWRGDKYMEGKKLDDMFAVRFHMGGDYDRTMLSAKDYKVDVWQWSAGRSNPSGFAEDMSHQITTKMIEDAAEYSLPGGKTVYIKKLRDAGTPPYKNLPRPKEKKGDRLPSFEVQKPAGSVADVAAKGIWKAGNWSLEFGRAMNTGNADDVVFKPGQKILGQIAIFNKGNAEHKSVSEPLLFDFSAVK